MRRPISFFIISLNRKISCCMTTRLRGAQRWTLTRLQSNFRGRRRQTRPAWVVSFHSDSDLWEVDPRLLIKDWLKAGWDCCDASFAHPLDKKYYGEEILSCTCDRTCHECIPPSINNNNNPISLHSLIKWALSYYPLSLRKMTILFLQLPSQ